MSSAGVGPWPYNDDEWVWDCDLCGAQIVGDDYMELDRAIDDHLDEFHGELELQLVNPEWWKENGWSG